MAGARVCPVEHTHLRTWLSQVFNLGQRVSLPPCTIAILLTIEKLSVCGLEAFGLQLLTSVAEVDEDSGRDSSRPLEV